MNPPQLTSDKGLLRLELSGEWSVEDLIALLSRMNLAYRRILALQADYLDTHLLQALQSLPEEVTGQHVFESIEAIAARWASALRIHHLEVGSPGFAELVGNLNPLKIIVDAVRDWRKENTNRLRGALEAETRLHETEVQSKTMIAVEQIRADARRFEAQANLLRELSRDRVSKISEGASAPAIDKFLGYMFDQPQQAIALIASDTRIGEISVHSAEFVPPDKNLEEQLAQLRPGLEVLDERGTNVGEIGEVSRQPRNFWLRRPVGTRDLWVPFTAVLGVRDGIVVLSIVASQIDEMGWQSPSGPAA